MDELTRHKIIYRILYHLIRWPLKVIFGYSCAKDTLTEPTLVVSNHVTDVDSFFLAVGFHGSHMYFVASDHMMRLGMLSKIIYWLVAPISRRKGTTAMDTAMTMMRKLRAGQSVCVFGEGESAWNGRSIPIYPATATIAKVSGRPLKTYRIEGGHLSMPRWGKGVRRGKVYGHVVNAYTPEQLKSMTADEINAAINRDLYEDAWERQKLHPVRYRSRRRAEGIENALFLCPKCRRIGTVRGCKQQVACDCGFAVEMTEFGSFAPAVPFANPGEWDDWQMACLKSGDYIKEGGFCDEGMTLYRVNTDGAKEELAQGALTLEDQALRLAERRFELDRISSLALIQKRLLVMTYEDSYYEIRASQPRCFRKYLVVWQNRREENGKGE